MFGGVPEGRRQVAFLDWLVFWKVLFPRGSVSDLGVYVLELRVRFARVFWWIFNRRVGSVISGGEPSGPL